MVSTFTPNLQLEEPARGDQVGVWDTPVNNNETLIDLVAGGITTISGSPGNVVLAAAQFQAKTITFNSTLVGNITVTFPTSFTKSYEIQNLCTGSSAFIITLGTTVAGGQAIAVPPGEISECLNDGTNLKFKNLGRVGSYWDHGGSSVPAWVSGCTVPPYLNCDGSTFSATTYPQLSIILGSTTLPDSRGRARFNLNQTTGRLNSSNSIDGNTRGTGGGSEFSQSHTHTILITDPGHTHGTNAQTGAATTGGGGFSVGNVSVATINTGFTGISASASNSGLGNSQNVPPAYIGGITMIRAA